MNESDRAPLASYMVFQQTTHATRSWSRATALVSVLSYKARNVGNGIEWLAPCNCGMSRCRFPSAMMSTIVALTGWRRSTVLSQNEPVARQVLGRSCPGIVLYFHDMAAKETTLKELGEMLTHVVDHMATKDDIATLAGQLTSMERELKAIRGDLDDLREKVENVSGFRKEIDHALERVAAIEKHLGLDKKIAA